MKTSPSHEADLVENQRLRRLSGIALVIAGVAACYFASGRLLVTLSAPPNGAVMAVWLPSGFTVAALALFGRWAALGSLIGSFALELCGGTPPAGAFLVAVDNALCEFLCYYLICRGNRTLSILEKANVFRLLLASLVSSAVSACFGVTVYLIFGVVTAAAYWSNWLTWFGSMVVGVLLVTPFLVYSVRSWPPFRRGIRDIETIASLAAVTLAALAWQSPVVARNSDDPLLLVVLLALLWIAFRSPPATMPQAVFCFAIGTVGGALLASNGSHDSEFVSLFALQLMLGGVAAIGYVLSSMVADQRRATEGLRLAAKVFDTTSEGILVTSADGSVLDVNSAFSTITGYPRDYAMGRHLSFLSSDHHRPEFYNALREALFASGEWQGEMWYTRADGTLLPAWFCLSAVRDDNGVTTEYVGLFSDITELRDAQNKLLSAARQAGMAEIATNVLHNVGNVLNSVNISAGLVSRTLRGSKAHGLAKAIRLMQEHESDLADFLSRDEKGKLLPEYLCKLESSLAEEQHGVVDELDRLIKHVDHIKRIIATQQSYAGASSMIEQVQARDLVEDALLTEADALARRSVTVLKEFEEVPLLSLDKARVLLILVNLIKNARHAMDRTDEESRTLTLRLGLTRGSAGQSLRICVEDTGEGISPENMGKIFAHGFTTRKEGHGFGLHSCGIAAGEMGGTLTVASDGPGRGASFTLEIPVASCHEDAQVQPPRFAA